MEHAFWHERWARDEIGFHQADGNAKLRRHWSRLAPRNGGRVLVPLCGKSLDLLWLYRQGFAVAGVELNRKAAGAFFTENGLDYSETRTHGLSCFRHGGLDVFCADFFELDAGMLGTVDAVYDRAALVALPPAMRGDYANHLVSLLPPGTPCLLVTLDYPQDQKKGPPFSVPPEEIHDLFGRRCIIEEIEAEDRLDREPRFREQGLDYLNERVFHIVTATDEGIDD